MQRLKKAIKRIAAIGTGVAMMGATMTGALALDLADYPAPYVDDGKFNSNTAIVVGASAAAADTLGGIDIAQSLQFESKVCTPSASGGSVQVSGDAIEISKVGDLLELDEYFGDVRETLTVVELAGLASGSVTTDEGTTAYNQYLRFSDMSPGYESILSPRVRYTENDAPVDEVGDWLYVEEGSGNISKSIFEYEIEFEDGLESDISTTTLEDLEDEELVILGTTYSIVDTKIDTTADDITLEFLGGAVYDVLEEGETKTYSVDGKDYEVNVLIIEDVSPATVTFVINGEITDQLLDGETEVLNDGTLIGISDIVLNEAGESGSGDIVEVYIGANKLELKDTDYTDSEISDTTNLGYYTGVEINEESIEDAWVQIKGNEQDSGSKYEIFSIKYRLLADALTGYKDVWVPPGHGIKEYLDEPEGMLGFDWDIKYEGLDDTGVSIVKLDPQGDDEYRLIFENSQGLVYNIPYITNEDGRFKFGDNDDDFVFIEGKLSTTMNTVAVIYNIGINDFFALSDMDEILDETATSHVIRYTSIETADKQLQFEDLATGNKKFIYEDISGVNNTVGRAELIFGGNTYTTYVANVSTTNDNPLAIDMNANGTIGRDEIEITINGGGILSLGTALHSDGGNWTGNGSYAGVGIEWANDHSSNITTSTLGGMYINLSTQDEDFDEGGSIERTAFLMENRSSNKMGISTTVRGGITVKQPDNDDDNYFGMTTYGVFVNLFDPEGTDDAETLTIEYPLMQRGAKAFVVFGDTSTTKTTAGETCSVAKIQINNLLDNEVSDPTDYNLILVGGPCANTLTADLFMACDAWTYGAGEAIIELASNGDNVAMLVAGTDAIDTRKAAKAIAGFEEFELAGTKAMVSGTLNSPSIATA